MKPKELLESNNKFKAHSLSEIRDIASEHSKTGLVIIIFLVVLLLLALQYIPHLQVAHFGITDPKDLADVENSYRGTLVQILGGLIGGIAVLYGIYMTIKTIQMSNQGQAIVLENMMVSYENSQANLKASYETQNTSNFTRAIDQLGSAPFETRLGGIYALERIANESEDYFWPIMEILTAYVRMNSNVENQLNKNYPTTKPISIDIQTILNVIKRCMSSYNIGEDNYLNLRETYLWKVNFICANLNKVDLSDAYLVEAILLKTNFENAKLNGANLTASSLIYAKLKGAELKLAQLVGANFAAADLKEVNLFSADLKGATFENANLEGAILFGAKNLTVDQLSKAKTLYNAKLDPELEEELRAKGFGHLLDYEP
jgi:uncharacterized protein YjbI with pentapeptide repeats